MKTEKPIWSFFFFLFQTRADFEFLLFGEQVCFEDSSLFLLKDRYPDGWPSLTFPTYSYLISTFIHLFYRWYQALLFRLPPNPV